MKTHNALRHAYYLAGYRGHAPVFSILTPAADRFAFLCGQMDRSSLRPLLDDFDASLFDPVTHERAPIVIL